MYNDGFPSKSDVIVLPKFSRVVAMVAAEIEYKT